MKRTAHTLFLAILLVGTIAMMMSGCAYVNNQNWNDLTAGEQEEVRQNFEEMREELEQAFPVDSAEGKFTSYILDKVEHAIEK